MLFDMSFAVVKLIIFKLAASILSHAVIQHILIIELHHKLNVFVVLE